MIQKRTMILVSDQPLQFEVVMDGGHEKHPPVKHAEAEHLDDHAQRLDHEQPADEQKEELHLGGDGHAGQTRTQRQGSRIPHEDGRPDGCCTTGSRRRPRSDTSPGWQGRCLPLQEGDARVGEERHGNRAGRQPVQSVGEVDGVGETGDEKEGEDVVENSRSPDPALTSGTMSLVSAPP